MAVKKTTIKSWDDVKAAAAARDAAKYTPKKTVTSSGGSVDTSSSAPQQTVATSAPESSIIDIYSAYKWGFGTPSSGDSGGNSGGNSQYTNYQYQIGSDLGKSVADNLPIGDTYRASDGSVWRKNNDGTISVDYNGYTTQNAYQMSDLGMLGTQQMNAGLDPLLVLSTANARRNKAATTPGLEQYANDALYNQMMQYVTRGQQQGYIDDWAEENPQPTAPKQDPRIDALLNQILNRDDFSYDVANDPLYQQYAQMYQREGDRAMRDTLAEVAAGAGGMNSYAITAAMQANNYYNSQLNDKIPELYKLAYDMYLNDKESKVQDLGILQNMDALQYDRYRDTMNDWRADKNFAYGMHRDAVADSQWQTSLDHNDYWANKNFDSNEYWANKDYEFKDYWANKDYEQTETDNAIKRVEWAIESGVMPSPEDIQKSGLSEEGIKARVKEVQDALATNVPVAVSKAYRADVTLPDSPKVETEAKGPGLPKGPEPPADISDYRVVGGNEDTGTIRVDGISGRISVSELDKLIEQGKVRQVLDHKDKTVSYELVQ